MTSPRYAHRPHRRENRIDHTTNRNDYRITATRPGQPDAVESTQDRRAARRIARTLAAAGAHVVVAQHTGHGAWREVYRLEPPTPAPAPPVAEIAPQTAAQDRAARERAAHLDRLARLMTTPPVTRPNTDRRARHTTGATR